MKGCRALGVGALTLLGLMCLNVVGGERSGGAVIFTSETINSGGIFFSSSGNISFGATIGQSSATEPVTIGSKSLAPGFWNHAPSGRAPSATLFLFR